MCGDGGARGVRAATVGAQAAGRDAHTNGKGESERPRCTFSPSLVEVM